MSSKLILFAVNVPRLKRGQIYNCFYFWQIVFEKKLKVPYYKEGDFVIHYPFLPLDVRENLMVVPELKRHKLRLSNE